MQSPSFNSISEAEAQAFSNHHVVIRDNFLPNEMAEELLLNLQKWDREKLFVSAQIGGGIQRHLNETIRGDLIYWLDFQKDLRLQTNLFQGIFKYLEQFREMLNQELYLGISHFECHLAHYAPGQGYQEHIDQPQKQSFLQGDRIVSFVLYLNKSWHKGDGGEFCYKNLLQSPSTLHVIEPLFNRFVFFRSDTVPHSVSSAGKDRLSLTGWMRRS